jgi:hypothetical protein
MILGLVSFWALLNIIRMLKIIGVGIALPTFSSFSLFKKALIHTGCPLGVSFFSYTCV